MIGKLLNKLLTGDFLAGKIRHVVGFLGGWLAASGFASVEASAELVEVITNILSSPEFLQGIGLYSVAYGSSVVNKVKKPK